QGHSEALASLHLCALSGASIPKRRIRVVSMSRVSPSITRAGPDTSAAKTPLAFASTIYPVSISELQDSFPDRRFSIVTRIACTLAVRAQAADTLGGFAMASLEGWLHYDRALSRSLASLRSVVSNPSVNQP